MSIEHLEAKIVKLKSQAKDLHAENRFLKQRLKEVVLSRDLQKQKYKQLQRGVVSKVSHESANSMVIKRHQYEEKTVRACINLYLLSGVSLRGVVAILLYFQLEWGIFKTVPSKSSIDNWLKKMGHSRYLSYQAYQYEDEYCFIVDDSMMVGSQRLLLILSLSANKVNKRALTYSDVHIESIEVKKSWSGESISAVIEKVIEKKGKKPLYCISDSASIMLKSQILSDLVHIGDCSHGLSGVLEKLYKENADFLAWQKELGQAKYKGIMKDYAYLLPPKQRSVARFMNMNDSVVWAKAMLDNFQKLSLEEQKAFEWIKQYKTFILNDVGLAFELVQKLLNILKNKGLSFKTVAQCVKLCKHKTYKNIPKVITKINEFLQNQKDKLVSPTCIWHNCSDVIESFFGKFKHSLPTNPILGVTASVLQLNLMTQPLGKLEVKEALEKVFLSDLQQWKHDNLFDNQVVRKHKILKNERKI
jgi:hypothetical protein